MAMRKCYQLWIATLLLFVGVACNRTAEPYLFLSGEGECMELSPRDTVLTLSVSGNVEWGLASSASWCVPHVTKGVGEADVQVRLFANEGQYERAATLTLSSADGLLSQSLTIEQRCLQADSTTRYRLPVVFHVLYQKEGNKKQYVLEGHLGELLEEVNRVYAQCGEELGLEFVMAAEDPEGNRLAEPGVDRHRINVSAINSSTFMGYGKEPKKYCEYMWDPNRYINIFVYTFEDKGILGISHFPYVIKPHALEGLAELECDADWGELPWPQCVCINNEYIYSHVEYYTISDVVNTLAHELGHFLGLRHAFSEDPVTYDRDVCYDSDFCTDTRTYNKAAYDKLMQAYMSSGGSVDSEEKELLFMREDCDTGEEFRSTNIMDYAYSEANRFTLQQAARIRYVLEHSPYVPGPKVRLPEQQVSTTKARVNQYELRTFE